MHPTSRLPVRSPEDSMVRTVVGIFCVVLVCFGWPGLLLATEGQEDLALEALSVFSAKCAGCHGPNLAKPRGRFGYVLDLARVAGNPEMVIPSSVDESELWELVRRGEMPPEDSPTGPPTEAEKETIRTWIAAGAPTKAASPPPSNSDTGPVSVSAPAGRKSILHILGPFHVLAVHFPIALLIVA